MKNLAWRNITRQQWTVFAAATLGYGLYYVCRLSFAVMKAPIVAEGALTEVQVGLVGSALFYVYAGGKLVNGFLADRVSLRKMLAGGLLVSAAVNLILGWSPGFFLFVALWGINGWVQSMGAPACVVGVARWFSRDQRGTFYGLWSASHNIGEGLTFLLTSGVVATLGWKVGFSAAGLAGLAGAAIAWLFYRDPPQVDPPAGVDQGSASGTQWQVLRNPVVWTIALASACMYVTRYAVNSWGVFYFQKARGLSAVQAGGMVAVSSVSGIVGTVISGWVSDAVFNGDRFRPTLWFGLLSAGSLALMLFSPTAWRWAGFAAMAGFGLAIGALMCYLGGLIAVDSVPRQAAGAALGVVGVASYVGAGTQDVISGWLIGRGRTGAVENAVYDFRAVSWCWLGAAFASILLVLLALRLHEKRRLEA